MFAWLHGCGPWSTEVETWVNTGHALTKSNILTATESLSGHWTLSVPIALVSFHRALYQRSKLFSWYHYLWFRFTEPCRTTRFRASQPIIWYPTDNWQGWDVNIPPGYIYVWINLKSSLAKFTTLNYKVDFNGLVSAVGGGLGLFLGVSVLTTLQSLYSCVGRKIKM